MNLRHVVLFCVVTALMTGAAQAQPSEQPAATSVFTLPEALEYANTHYPTVRAAIEQVNASTANVNVARSVYLPRFDAIWQTNRGTVNNIFGQLLPQSVISSLSGPVLSSSSSDSVWGTATGGLLSWEPFDFGLRGSTVREAEAALNRAHADEGVTRLAVQHAVALAFLNAVAAQQAVTAAEADVQRRQTIAQAARTLADNQLRPGAEASRADAERAAALTRAIQARQALAIARATLTQVLGLVDGPVAVNASALLEAAPPGKTPPVPDRLRHPLIQSGQAAVDLARARESVLAATDRPRVLLQSSLFARGSGATPEAIFGGSQGLGFDRANWAAGVQIVFPNLFDFASLRARRAAAGALTRAEGARYDEAVLKISSEERAAEAMVAATREIAQNTPVQLAAAQQSETQARARYEAGLASIVEVAEAQNLLVQAEYLNAMARVDVWRALLSQAVARGALGSFIDTLRASGVQ
jgi:outer membrane protein TolC